MRLQLFRDHLAIELRNMPDVRVQEVQSYALTTAILTRSLVERLRIDDLNIERSHDPQGRTYKLKRILNNIIHYRGFHPDSLHSLRYSSDDPADNIIRLYSCETRNAGDFFRFSLGTYFELISKFTHDDLFMGSYLFRRVITCLYQVTKVNQGFDPDFLSEISDLIGDALELAAKLDKANEITIPSDPIVRYIDASQNPLTDGFLWKTGPPLGSSEFVHGFNKAWRFSPFNPRREKLGEVDAYCAPAEVIGPIGSGNWSTFIVPLQSFLNLFKAIKEQCDAAQDRHAIGRKRV